jgi:hypothetical protein
MHWFWIHTVLSVLSGLIFVVAAVNGFSIYKHKMMMSYRSLPELIGKHIKLGYFCSFLFLLCLLSGEMVRPWSGWYVSMHKIIPLVFIPVFLIGIYSGFLLKNSTGRRPLLHVFMFALASGLTLLQLLTGLIMLGLVWSN